MITDVCAANGSSTAVAQSGTSIMSDSLIAFHPAIDDPSNITPSLRKSSVIVRTWCARCCHLPRGSVNRKSTYLTSCSLIISMTFLVSAILSFHFQIDRTVERAIAPTWTAARSDRVRTALAGADPDRFVDRGDKDLAVADAASMSGLLYRLHRTLDQRVFHDDLYFHLRQEIHHVLGAAIQLSMALLTAKPFGLGHRDPLDADFVEGFLHFVELEGFDDRLDLLHRLSTLS